MLDSLGLASVDRIATGQTPSAFTSPSRSAASAAHATIRSSVAPIRVTARAFNGRSVIHAGTVFSSCMIPKSRHRAASDVSRFWQFDWAWFVGLNVDNDTRARDSMTTLVSEDHDLIAIGRLASNLRATVREVEQAAERAGVAPEWRLNGVNHFTATAADKIAAELRDTK
jgi:hypothetical protein